MDSQTVGIILAAGAVFVTWRVGVLQHKIEASNFTAEWLRDLRSWAGEAIDVLSEAAYICAADHLHVDDLKNRKLVCRFKISALIDRGRFFLPNIENEYLGNEKPVAYRGERHPALDYLVAADRILSDKEMEFTSEGITTTRILVALKRDFVSELHEILQPRAQNRQVIKLLDIARGEPLTPLPWLMKLLPENFRPNGVENRE